MHKINEKDYPMTYKEYEERVIELFLRTYPEDKQEIMVERLDKLFEKDPKFLDGLYGQTCFYYDHPDLYDETVLKMFDDYHLEAVPVHNLHMVLGGNFEKK